MCSLSSRRKKNNSRIFGAAGSALRPQWPQGSQDVLSLAAAQTNPGSCRRKEPQDLQCRGECIAQWHQGSQGLLYLATWVNPGCREKQAHDLWCHGERIAHPVALKILGLACICFTEKEGGLQARLEPCGSRSRPVNRMLDTPAPVPLSVQLFSFNQFRHLLLFISSTMKGSNWILSILSSKQYVL